MLVIVALQPAIGDVILSFFQFSRVKYNDGEPIFLYRNFN